MITRFLRTPVVLRHLFAPTIRNPVFNTMHTTYRQLPGSVVCFGSQHKELESETEEEESDIDGYSTEDTSDECDPNAVNHGLESGDAVSGEEGDGLWTPDELIEAYKEEPHETVVGLSRGGQKICVGDIERFEEDMIETFIRGGGNGGQKVNKTSNCVHLRHIPTGTIVKCHAQRHLEDNRRIARKIMRDKLEELYLGSESRIQRKHERVRKKKANRKRKSKKKYTNPTDTTAKKK